MRMPRVRTACCLLLLAVAAGCRSGVAETDAPPEDQTTHLGDKIDISLADWLKRPRADLARMGDEWVVTVEKLQDYGRTHAEAVELLPQLHAPVTVPVYGKCRWSAAAGISLPPYLKEGERDAAVALHLARHGDREAALQLANPDDKDLLAQIDAWRTDRDYPLEWTRLVSLALQAAQFKMAHGSVEGATELVLLHRQLREVLDPRAAKGPLGAALLPVGRHAVALAAAAWRDPKVNKKALAQDLEGALAQWGEWPAPVFGLPAQARKTEIVRVFGRPAEGCTVTAAKSDGVQRALDLLAVPVTPEGVEAVVAFLDGKDRLDGVLLLYRPKINELFPEPAHLALPLQDRGFSSKAPASAAGLLRQVYEGGGLNYDVEVATRGNAVGALVQVGPVGKESDTTATGRNPRDFGAVSLNRSFTANRTALAPRQGGHKLTLVGKNALSKVAQPVKAFAPQELVLEREPGHDVVSSLRLLWDKEESQDALYRLGLPLWSAYGRSRIAGKEDQSGGFLVLTWEQGSTRTRLRLPYDQRSPELVVEDTRGPAAGAERALAAQQRDREERQARLAAGKPQVRLPRTLEVNAPVTNGLQVEGLQLGMTREEALATLPGSASVRRQALSDGVNLLFTAEPPLSAPYWARQMFVRFGPDNRVAEVRVRYQEGPGMPSAKSPSLLDALKKVAGAPEELPGAWAGLWADLGGRKTSILYRWHDDTTQLTLQRDEGGAEVTLRDCPADRPQGVELPPLQFCPRGVELCALGDRRATILRRFNVKQPPTAANGAEVLAAPEGSPYDLLLVWSDNGGVSRIIARHRDKPAGSDEGVAAALQQAWARNIDRLGYVRRMEGPRGQVKGAYDWHDDVTRVRTFVQDTEQGPRVFTEFRTWPVVVTPVPVVKK